MERDDERLELPRDRQHAEGALHDHGEQQEHDVRNRNRPIPARGDRHRRDDDDDEAERRRRVAMDHLAPRLADVEWSVRISGL